MPPHEPKRPAVATFGASDGFTSRGVGLHNGARHVDVPNTPELAVVELPGDGNRVMYGRNLGKGPTKSGAPIKPVQLVVTPSSVDGYEDGARTSVDFDTPGRHRTERSGANKWKNGSANSTLRSTWAGDSQRKVSGSVTNLANVQIKAARPERQVCRTGDQKRWEQWLSTDGANLKLCLPPDAETNSCSARFGKSARNLQSSGKWGVNDVWEIQTYETTRLKERENAKYLDSWRESMKKKPHADIYNTDRIGLQTTDRLSKQSSIDVRSKEAYGVVKNSTGRTYAFFAEEVEPSTKKNNWRP